MAHFDSSGTYISGFSYATRPTITFTTPSNESYSLVSVGTNPAQTGQYDINFMQIELGSSASPYMPYGTYNWYIEKNIAKVVLNGSETGWSYNSGNGFLLLNTDTTFSKRNLTIYDGFCNYFSVNKNSNTWTNVNYVGWNSANTFWLKDNGSIATSVADFKTWLSTNNVNVYYILANPTYEIITNDYLIEQLEAAQNMYLVNNLCYINWEGNIPAVFTLQYPTTDTINDNIATEDNKLIRTEWGS